MSSAKANTSNAGRLFILLFSLMALGGSAQPPSTEGDPVTRIRALRSAERQKASQDVLIRLAIAYYDVRQFRLFELTMSEALAMDPRNHSPHYYLGRYYQSIRDDLATGAKYLEEALRRNPDDFRSLYYLGLSDEKQDRKDAAEERYHAAARLAQSRNVRFSLPYEGLARLRLNAADPNSALALARRAVELDSASPSAYRLLAKCLDQTGRGADAVEAWRMVVRLEPADAPALYGLYRAQLAAGQSSEARQTLAQYRRVAVTYAPE